MAFAYFLHIDGVDGESVDAKHKAWIDVESWSWGETNTTVHFGSGSGSGRPQMQDFHFVSHVSKASPTLFLACASGQHLKEAQLVGRRPGKGQEDFLTWTFSDVLVSSYQTGGSEAGDNPPMDQVSLNFAKVKVEYKAQKANGSLAKPVSGGWDVITNTKL
jgi:type VI secretion system secreted protein Hcp